MTPTEPEWHGQYLQDRYVWQHFFQHTPKAHSGVFLDVGASDGHRFSNTMALENLGWSGLCVEARRSAADACRRCRPGSIVENVAIAEQAGTVEFMEIEGYGEGLSGVVQQYDPKHLQRIKQETRNPACLTPVPHLYPLQAVPLQQLLDKHSLHDIDYFSLDVEGSELAVLRSVDWQRTRVQIIDVEINYDPQPITRYLEALGYRKHSSIGCDTIFQHVDAA